MIWPFGRREVRESGGGYEAALLAAFEASAVSTPAPTATGALQAASGLVSRCFAAASVDGPPHLTAAVTPAVLSMIGRALIRRGEIVFSINVDPSGRVRLAVAGHHDVHGPPAPDAWTYRVSEYGPSGTLTRMLPAAAVVHARFESDPIRPWCGIGPLQSAALAGRLSAETVAALADAESGPRGGLLPLPVDGNDPTVADLKTDIKALRGRIATVESVRTMHPGAVGNAPSGDWDVKRIGADPPAAEVALLGAATVEVLAACGVPASLFVGRDGATRELPAAPAQHRATAWADRLGRAVRQARRGRSARLR